MVFQDVFDNEAIGVKCSNGVIVTIMHKELEELHNINVVTRKLWLLLISLVLFFIIQTHRDHVFAWASNGVVCWSDVCNNIRQEYGYRLWCFVLHE